MVAEVAEFTGGARGTSAAWKEGGGPIFDEPDLRRRMEEVGFLRTRGWIVFYEG